MDIVYQQSIEEKENQKKGFLFSIVFHVLVLLLFLIPWLVSKEYPPLDKQEGVLVSFGIPDGGSSPAKNVAPVDNKKEKKQSKAEPKKTTPKKTTPKKKSSSSKKKVAEKTSTVKTVDEKSETPVKAAVSEEIKIDPAVAAEKAAKAKREAEEKAAKEAQELAEAEAKAAEEAKKQKEAEEKAKYNEAKSKFSDLFSSGGGQGDNNAAESKGDPKGDPDASALEGLGKGSDRVGGGLGGRGILYEPNIKDNSQKQGKVVIKVCVNAEGKVTSAKYTQKGSSTTDDYLVSLAKKSASQYKFTPSNIAEQCGTITVDFKLK